MYQSLTTQKLMSDCFGVLYVPSTYPMAEGKHLMQVLPAHFLWTIAGSAEVMFIDMATRNAMARDVHMGSSVHVDALSSSRARQNSAGCWARGKRGIPRSVGEQSKTGV